MSVSHILIRHRDANEDDMRFRAPDWAPDVGSARTREEALAIASDLSTKLRREPSRFPELARTASEDAVTAPWGGALGTVPASRLPGAILDAIAKLSPGEVSLPVETPFGVHVIRVEPLPAEQLLAARRIVVSYVHGGTSLLRPGHERKRTRAEALAIARSVSARAKESGADFSALVSQYSDTVDFRANGDIGVWSTYRPDERGLALSAIAAVPVGGITEPVDSGEGFQIFQRTPADSREEFAATFVAFEFGSPAERKDAYDHMSEIAARVRANPDDFASFQQKFCCTRPSRWTQGRGPGTVVEAALRRLKYEEIDVAPVETESAFYLLERLDPQRMAPEPPPLVQLPQPDEPDLDAIIVNSPTAGLVRNIQMLRQTVRTGVDLTEKKHSDVDRLLDGLSGNLTRAPTDQRTQLVERFWAEVAGTLSPAEVRLLRDHIVQVVSRQLMNG